MTISLPQDIATSATLLFVGSAVVLVLVYLCLRDGVVPNRGWKVKLFVFLSGVLFWGGASLASERL